jgi:hypothetical protein
MRRISISSWRSTRNRLRRGSGDRVSRAATEPQGEVSHIAATKRQVVLFCLGVYLAARIAISLVGVVFVGTHAPDASAFAPLAPPSRYTSPATPGWHNAIDGLQRWDAAWFQWVAVEGYDGGTDARPAFYPGYPALISAGHEIGLSPGAAATISSNLAYLLALIVLFVLSSEEIGPTHARWAVAFFASMPTSFFFLAPYSESPFLVTTLFAFLCARRQRWAMAALAGVAAGLIRPMAIALIPAMWLMARRSKARKGSVLAIAAPVLGTCCVLAAWAIAGNPDAPFTAQAYWGRHTGFAPGTVIRGLTFAVLAVQHGIRTDLVVDGIIVAAVLGTSVLAVWRLRPPYVAYLWVTIVIALSLPWTLRPFLSIPRFACVLFPLTWTWVVTIRRRVLLGGVVAVLFVSQLTLAAVFMNWGWIF